MATQTTHYSLIKPSSADRVAVGDLNDNADTIDGYLYIANERADQIADDYNTSSTYNIGDYCRRENYIYKCNSNSVTGNWDSTKWDRVKVMESIVDVNERIDVESNTFSASGESFALTSTSEGSVLAHTLYGMSVQDGTPTPSSPVDIESSVANFTCTNSDNTESITITTDLVLRAIEVTSSDDYNLVRGGKYYIADSVDWSEDDGYVLTRRIANASITDFTDWRYSPLEKNVAIQVSTVFGQYIVLPSNDDTKGYIICNYLETQTRNDVVSGTEKGIAISRARNVIVFIEGMTSLEDYQSWISGKTVEINAILDTPTIEQLTAKQAEALLLLKTYDTATSITCTADVSPTMAIEYAKERVPALALSGHNESELKVDWASENVLGAKNLIPYPYSDTTRTVSGITSTANADGSISISGTTTETIGNSAIFYIDNSTSDEMWLDEGTYIFSAPTDAYAKHRVYFFIRVYHTNGTNTLYDVKSSDVEVTITSDDVNIRCGVSIPVTSSGTTIDTTVYPMFRLASVKDSTYAPYAMTNKDLTDVVKCNQTTAGTYTLQATVASNGAVTYEWVSTT